MTSNREKANHQVNGTVNWISTEYSHKSSR
jgi:hypothetical protein